MKNLVIILCLLIFNTSAFSDSTSNFVADKHKDNEWIVSYITKNSIHASVNGQVTHGDGLHVRFVKGKCDVGNLLTFVYSYSKNPDLVNFKNKYVTTKFMGEKIIGEENKATSLLRDILNSSFDNIIIDDKELHKEVKSYVKKFEPKKEKIVKLYSSP